MNFPINQILLGDAIEVLKTLPDNSVDALITDPPAGISFMGKSFDHHRGGMIPWVNWLSEIMAESLRVMKPGAIGLVWSIPRTCGWTQLALELAGFRVIDSIAILNGSGFPKGADISKHIDKLNECDRDVVGYKKHLNHAERGDSNLDEQKHNRVTGYGSAKKEGASVETAPNHPDAVKWGGWKSAQLKPSHEDWFIVQKPVEGTIARNVLKWGTGGVNISACKIPVNQGSANQSQQGLEYNVQGYQPKDVCLQNQDNTPALFAKNSAKQDAEESCLNSAIANVVTNQDEDDTTILLSSLTKKDTSEQSIGTIHNKSTCMNLCTTEFGKGQEKEKSQADFYCTTSTKTDLTTDSKTLSLCEEESTLKFTEKTKRITLTEEAHHSIQRRGETSKEKSFEKKEDNGGENIGSKESSSGRFPSNTILICSHDCKDGTHSESCPVSVLDEQGGERKSGGGIKNRAGSVSENGITGGRRVSHFDNKGIGNDTGTAARYFKQLPHDSETFETFKYQTKASQRDRSCDGAVDNIHPTVKNRHLCRYLCKLITPPGGVVLDPFGGSGSTAIGAIEEGFNYLLIEKEEEYHAIALARIAATLNVKQLVLEVF